MKDLTTMLFVLLLLVAGEASMAQKCNDAEQTEVRHDFDKCLTDRTNEHHQKSEKAGSNKERQTLTCQLLSETAACGNILKRCDDDEDVIRVKDMHIAARMQQFAGRNDGVDVKLCPVVIEYLDSGRADTKANEHDKCTNAEVNSVRAEFQKCSYDFSGSVWEKLQDLKDATVTQHRRKHEERQPTQESQQEFLRNEVKSMFCESLAKIRNECGKQLTTCFTAEDAQQMRGQNMKQMTDYFISGYDGIDSLDDCEEDASVNEVDINSTKSPEKTSTTENSFPKENQWETLANTTGDQHNPFEDDDDEVLDGLDYEGETNEIDGGKQPPAKVISTRSENPTTPVSATAPPSSSSSPSSASPPPPSPPPPVSAAGFASGGSSSPSSTSASSDANIVADGDDKFEADKLSNEGGDGNVNSASCAAASMSVAVLASLRWTL